MAAKKSDIDIGPQPDVNFTYKVKGKEHTLFMSYALLNRLARLEPDIDKLMRIIAAPALQDEIIMVLLAPRAGGKPDIENFDLERDTADISYEDIEKMLMWAVGHISHFFIGLMNRNLEHAGVTRKTIELIQKKTEILIDSNNGLTV